MCKEVSFGRSKQYYLVDEYHFTNLANIKQVVRACYSFENGVIFINDIVKLHV